MTQTPGSPTSTTSSGSPPGSPTEWNSPSSFRPAFYAPPYSLSQRTNSNPQSTTLHREDSTFSQRSTPRTRQQSSHSSYYASNGGIPRRSTNPSHINGYTECGRHGDDWLFGGLSVVGMVKGVKKVFEKK
ncbi:hypothetical protein BGZ60DRAFT_425910 [Tricladium varicosporioides]|nr:hypothetical protein BGZ60DRAFT_425910 [Hymenoscyphus varicosporioides]